MAVTKLSSEMRALVKTFKMKLLFNRKTAAFYAPFAYLPVHQDEDFPTYYTDGRQVVISPKFTKIIGEEKALGVFFHEFIHNVLGHTSKDFPKVTHEQVMRKAQEIAVNNIVMECGLHIPEDGVIEPRYKGWSTLAIYKDLVENQNETDEHTHEGCGCCIITPDTDKDPNQGDGAPQGEDSIGKLPERLSSSQVAIKLGEVHRLLTQAGNSTLTRTISGLIDEVVVPVIDWSDKLFDSFRRSFDGVTLDLSNPVPQYMDAGIYIPKYKDQSIENLYIGFDVSCSLDDIQLSKGQKIINNIKDIYQIENTVLITYNHEIVERTEYSEHELVDLTKLQGGGGTRGDALFEYLEENNETPYALLIVTDTEDDIQTPAESVRYPVIWLNTSEHEAFRWGKKPEFGEIISI